jgi:hypothetical protein
MYKNSLFNGKGKIALASFIFTALLSTNASAWSEHSLITYPVLKTIPEVADQAPIKVETLEEFVRAEAKGLEKLLAKDEAWLRENYEHYLPRPEALAFKADGSAEDTMAGNSDDILMRFIHAIRINPEARVQPYVQLLPGQDMQGRRRMASTEVAVFKTLDNYDKMTFVEVNSGDMVTPIEVLVSANDDPDNGLDIGLFEDSNTEIGKQYGFGVQAFGNPTLEYGTQAPFHMAFYYESDVIFTLAPFLHRTFPNYRVHMYKALSQYAFQTGHDYWGWRFMGWGMHYIGDIAQSYHSTMQPGVGTMSSLWMNMKDVVGLPQSQTDAIQLLSNRHMVIEKFQETVAKDAYVNQDFSSQVFEALRTPGDVPEYNEYTFVEVFAKKSHDKADKLAGFLEQWVPEKLVSDPSFELSGTEEAETIVPMIRAEFGEEGVTQMTNMLTEFMVDHSANTRSYINAILSHKQK